MSHCFPLWKTATCWLTNECFGLRWMSFHMNHLWWGKKERGVPDGCLFFLCVLFVPVNLRPLSGKKTGKQRGCHRGPKNKPETPPSLAKRTLSPNMFRPRPLPGLLRCYPALAHLLLVIGVQGHLFCDLWWQWSSSLVGPQETVWSFDEAFAFTFSAKVWWPVAGTLPSNKLVVSCRENLLQQKIK